MTARDRSGGVFSAIGEAIADIREKLVEEGWFGRALTPQDRPISHALGITPTERESSPLDRLGPEHFISESERDATARAPDNPISDAFGVTLDPDEKKLREWLGPEHFISETERDAAAYARAKPISEALGWGRSDSAAAPQPPEPEIDHGLDWDR